MGHSKNPQAGFTLLETTISMVLMAIVGLGAGTINRDGGGNGNIYGSITVAKFDQNGTRGFLAPSFTTNGAGNSTIQYDSDAVRRALNLSGPLVLGVREY